MSAPFVTREFWNSFLEERIIKQGIVPTEEAQDAFDLNCGRFVDRVSMSGPLKEHASQECEFSLTIMDDRGICLIWRAPTGEPIGLVIKADGTNQIIDEVAR